MFQSVAQPPGLAADATDHMADDQHAHESVQGAAEPVQDALRQTPQHSGAQQGRHENELDRNIKDQRNDLREEILELWNSVMWQRWQIDCLHNENCTLKGKLAMFETKMKETELHKVSLEEGAEALRNQVEHLTQSHTHIMNTMVASRTAMTEYRVKSLEDTLKKVRAALSGEGAGVHPGLRGVGGRGGRGRGGTR